jgi:membrane protease YdiL (CAAX protease family)
VKLPEVSISSIGERKPSLKTSRLEKVTSSVFFFLVTGAEALTIYNPTFGITLHVVILFSILTASVLIKNSAFSSLLFALAIIPLIRIISLSLPLTYFGYIMWFLLTSVPIFIAVFACMMIQRLSLKEAGITLPKAKDLPIQIGVILMAVPIGIVEYHLLRPQPLSYGLEPTLLIATVIILVIYTGFVEELAFRGLLQYHAIKTMGWWGILLITALFGIMHLGNLSPWDVLLAFTVGGIYALVAQKTGSIYGVSLSHGLVNVTLFLFAPIYLS